MPISTDPIAPSVAGYGFADLTPDDDVIYSPPLTVLYVGGTGHLSLTLGNDGTAVLLSDVPQGTFITCFAISRVNDSDTTATLLVGARSAPTAN